MIPVAEAVAAAHARDVVHRDLKPANIFLAREGNKIIPKVLDFGACLYQTVGTLSAKERRMLIGTPHYMAPEQITTAADVDARADVWAMGVILYEMLVGITPFEAEDANSVLKLVRTRAVPNLRKVAPDSPESLEDLVGRCLDRDRKKRFANAAAVREELEAIRKVLRRGISRSRVETPADIEQELGPARNEPKSNVLKGAKKDPGKDKIEASKEETDEVAPSVRIPSLVLRGAKTPAKRRGSSLLNLSPPHSLLDLSAPEDDSVWDAAPPRSASRPIEAAKSSHSAKPARTAADVIRDAEEAGGVTTTSKPPQAPSLPPGAINALSLPVPATVSSSPPASPRNLEAGAPRDLDFDDSDHRALDLDLDPPSSRHGAPHSARPGQAPPAAASLPPVLDPRSASPSRVGKSDRPPASSDPLRTSGVKTRDFSLTPPLGPPALRSPRAPGTSLPAEPSTWTASANASFGLTVIVPAVVAFIALRQAPFITAPLGHAMRGDSPLASGVLAVVALIGAAALASKSLGSSRSNALVVATIGAVLAGIVMIIVTFSASETAELEIPPAAAGIVPFIAPIVPLGLGLWALARARGGWLSRYERRDAVTFAVVATLMLFAVLELGPLGAVRGLTPSAGSTPAAHTTSPPPAPAPESR